MGWYNRMNSCRKWNCLSFLQSISLLNVIVLERKRKFLIICQNICNILNFFKLQIHPIPQLDRKFKSLNHIYFTTWDSLSMSGTDAVIKGELRNRFNLISEERVKFCEQNSENLIKIGWKIRKLWHFEVSQIFTKHFLTSRYEYANERVDDVIASLLAIYFVHKMLKNSIFCAYLW